jgi:DNA-binding beta-propeller fold protein YncE
VNASTGGTTTLLGVLAPGSPGTGYVDGPPAQARLNYPSEALLHPVLGYVIAESGNNALRVLDAGGLGVSTLVGPGGPAAAGFADGPAPLARLRSPTGLVLGPDNATMYVFDSTNHAIRVVSCGAASASARRPPPGGGAAPPPAGHPPPRLLWRQLHHHHSHGRQWAGQCQC